MSLPYSPISPKNTMSSGQGPKLPSLSKQFPEVFSSQQPQSPPDTPTSTSPSTRFSPSKRRWSERTESEDDEPERKRLASHVIADASSTSTMPVPSLRSPRCAPRNPIQLPPLQTYLRDHHESQQHPSSAGLRQDTRPENFQLSHPTALDSVSLARPSLTLEHPRHPTRLMSERLPKEVGRELSAPPIGRPPMVSVVPGIVPSPTHPALPRSAPSAYPLPLPRRDEYGRSYSATCSTHSSLYAPIAVSPESRRYSLDQMSTLSSHTQTTPTDAASRYIWEMPPAGTASSAVPLGGMANPNGRKRRGNLPKESTQVLNDWFVKHASFPYPKESEKQQLQAATGLSLSQISNWFINARRRRRPETTNAAPHAHAHVHAQDPRDYPPPGRGAPSQPLPHGSHPYPPQNQWGRMP